MVTMTKHITVAAPPEAVFDIIDDPDHLPEIWRNLSNIRNVQRLPNGGTAFGFDYTMAGIRVEGFSTDLEHERPRCIVNRTTGGITSTLTWTFEPSPDGNETDLTVEVEYDVPIPLVGKLAEVIVAKINEADVVYVLNYLKLKLEVPGR